MKRISEEEELLALCEKNCAKLCKEIAAERQRRKQAERDLVDLIVRALPFIDSLTHEADRLRCDIADTLAEVKEGN